MHIINSLNSLLRTAKDEDEIKDYRHNESIFLSFFFPFLVGSFVLLLARVVAIFNANLKVLK